MVAQDCVRIIQDRLRGRILFFLVNIIAAACSDRAKKRRLVAA
jgi:hypothetical protein